MSVHIWFVLDRPVGQDELKAYHELKAPDVDRALFRTVQVHYVAAPIFEDGITDHLPKRIGLVELQADKVHMPELPPEAIASAYRTIGSGPTGTVHGFEAKLKLLGDGEGLGGFHAVLIGAVASYVYGKFEWEIDTEWLKARLRDAIDKAPKRVGRDVSTYLIDSYLNQNIGTATNKYCQVVTTPKYPAPWMTPEQARGEIKSSLWAAVDRHFEALSDWEKVNRVYQDGYAKLYYRAEAAIKSAGLEFDAVELARETRRALRGDPKFQSLEHPGHTPQEVLSLAVGVGLGKTEQALKVVKYVRDKA